MNQLVFTRFLSLTFLFLSLNATGQDPDSLFFEGMDFRNIGPAGMSGRVTAIDVDLSDPERIFIGTASGGVWKSEDGGVHWTPVFDHASTLAIGALKIDQSNPSIIWVGTGEGNPRNSLNSGNGIYKTLDGGKTWKNLGLEQTKLIHRILIDPHNPEVVYIGAMGSAWGPNPERGVYKTTNGGKEWERILFVNDSTGVGDMVMDPFNPRKLIVAMWEYGRKPWTFTSGGAGSGLYLTYDGGESWKRLDSKAGLPKGELGRIGVAIAYSKPNIVYALIEAKKNGLYKSENGGHNWKLVAERNIGNRPFYYAEIYVDPQNENRIWNLWSYLSKSEDGGKSFETILDYGKGVHPDHHAFWQHPHEPGYIIDGNDGGLNISRDRGTNWRFVTNIPVGQFYHINIDNDLPYNVYGGMQDNGSWIGPAYVLKNGGIRNADWREVYFGDGFDVMPRMDNLRYGWAMSQGGNLSYYDKATGNDEFIKPAHPEGVELRFNWNAALAQDPGSPCGIYYGSQFVHKSEDCGRSWKIISPDLTTNDSTKQRQFESGGLTIDDTQAENHTTILCIEPSTLEAGLIWAGTDDGNVHATRDMGENWVNHSPKMPGFPEGSWIPQIHASLHDAGEAFVVVNNYRRNDWDPYLYHTRDYGATWQRIAAPGDIGTFVVSIIQDPEVPELLFLGADDGLYFSINRGADWRKWPTEKFPPVQIRDMKIHQREDDLVIGTFGRAIWVLDNIRPLREYARAEGKVVQEKLNVFESPQGYLYSYRSVDGIRFTADAEFRGENKARGLPVRIWVKPEEKEKKEMEEKKELEGKKKGEPEGTGETEMPVDSSKTKQDGNQLKPDEARIVILNSTGDTMRQYTTKLKPGLNNLSWNMRRDGVRSPTRREIEEGDDAGSGNPVLPGDYRFVVIHKKMKDSISVKVNPDPRIAGSLQGMAAKDEVLAQLDSLRHACFLAFERLKGARNTINLVNQVMEHQPDSLKEKIKKEGKDLVKTIDSLEQLYMLPSDSKGYQDNSKTVNAKLGTASRYLNTSRGLPGENAMFALKNARVAAVPAIEAINTFLENAWAQYKLSVESLELKLFKSLDPVGIPGG